MKLTHLKPKTLVLGLSGLLLATLGFSSKPAVVMAASAPAMHVAADNDALDFDLVNRTGYTLKQVLISRSSASEWNADDDVLGGRKFEDGDTLHITFSPRTQAEHWDMKVIYAIDGSSHEWDGLNLTHISKVTLHYDAGADSTSADVE